MRKFKLILIGAVSVCILFLILFFIVFGGRSVSPGNPPVTPTDIPANIQIPTYIEEPTLYPTKMPTPQVLPTNYTLKGEKVRVGKVVMNNFYTIAVSIHGNDVLIKQTDTYKISFLGNFRTFLISVLSAPFQSIQVQAEQDFLRTLNITQTDACQLYAYVTTSYTVNPDFAGTRYPLSFCK